MERSNQINGNRTGMDVSPLLAKQMLAGAEQYSPAAGDGNLAFAALEGQYIRAENSVGSMPPPGSVKGTLKTLAKKLTGRNSNVLLNKLGERLAYERSGVRLYEAFIRKCETLQNGATESLIPLDELWEIRNEEEEHFLMLQDCILQLGADPTAQTPDADVSGVASRGMMQVITDPRTTLSQGLEVLLSIELIDNSAWDLLITLCEEMKLDDMAKRFRAALAQEESHLQRARTWYENGVRGALEMDAGTTQ